MRNLLAAFAISCAVLSVSALRTTNIAASGSSVDWSTLGKVTVAKDQYACNASYAFALVSNIESVWAIAGGSLKNLSAQELISCSGVGCTESSTGVSSAASWLVNKNSGNIDTADSVPFTSYHGNVPLCNTQNGVVGATVKSINDISGQSEASIAGYVNSNGPVIAYVDPTGLQNGYTSGVWNGCPASPNPTHAVLLVGFNNASSSGSYWVAKNSWGQSWGEDGFFKIPYGTNACGVTTSVSSVETMGGTLPPTPNPMGTRTPAPPVPPPTPMPPTPQGPTNSPGGHGHHTYAPGSGGSKYTAYICSNYDCKECYEKHLYPGECGYASGWSFKVWCDGNGQTGSQNINANLYAEDKCEGHYNVKKSFSDYCFSATDNNSSSTSGGGFGLNIPYGTHLKIKCPGDKKY